VNVKNPASPWNLAGTHQLNQACYRLSFRARPLVARLASQIGKDGASAVISDVAWVLLDQARIIEGESLPDPAAFSRRLSALLEKGLG